MALPSQLASLVIPAPCAGMATASTLAAVVAVLFLGAAAYGVWTERRRRRLHQDYRRLRGDLTSAHEHAASLRGEKTQILRLAMQDLVAPLSQLSDDIEALAHAPLPAPAATTLREVREDVARMRRALAALNELQALEDRSRSLILTGVNVGAVLLEAVANNREAAERKNVRLSVPAPHRTTLASADAEVLRKVFENLIHDAVEVTPGGSTVSLSVYQTSDRVLITVSDEGPGVSVADQAQLLSQSGNSRPPMGLPDNGPRLNLGMVHNLVKAMDGWLWTQGEPGRGTTHVVELSLARAPRPAASSGRN